MPEEVQWASLPMLFSVSVSQTSTHHVKCPTPYEHTEGHHDQGPAGMHLGLTLMKFLSPFEPK